MCCTVVVDVYGSTGSSSSHVTPCVVKTTGLCEHDWVLLQNHTYTKRCVNYQWCVYFFFTCMLAWCRINILNENEPFITMVYGTTYTMVYKTMYNWRWYTKPCIQWYTKPCIIINGIQNHVYNGIQNHVSMVYKTIHIEQWYGALDNIQVTFNFVRCV